jgi:hypothetical protein
MTGDARGGKSLLTSLLKCWIIPAKWMVMMLLKEIYRDWFQKFIYAFLVFCIGGINSLVYFDDFLPGHEHGLHPYHLSIWTEPVHHHNPLPPL